MRRPRFQSRKGERGQLLPLAIILLGVGTLMVTTLMPFLTTMLQSGYKERERAMARYAAEAAINRVIADMIRGADAYPTTYTTTTPHGGGGSYDTFNITTSYTAANVTVNNYTASVTISIPSANQSKPSDQQSYIDPGVTHPQLAIIETGYAYLVRLYNVKAGTIQVNWAYEQQSSSKIGIWTGMPVDSQTNLPYPPGRINKWPTEKPILETSQVPDNRIYNRTEAVVVDPTTDDSGGVYTIVFDNSRGGVAKTTNAFQPSGGTNDTWIYVNAYKDYLVTATAENVANTADNVTISAYVRQVPGFMEPPAESTAWSVTNPSFTTNKVYVYTWSPP